MLLFRLLAVIIIISACSITEDEEAIKSTYDKDSVQYKTLKYYKKEDQKEPTTAQEISSMNSYYKVYTIKNTKQPIKEEYHNNNKLEWYKTFFYGRDNALKSITYSNNSNGKIKELIYDENKNILFRTEYAYDRNSNLTEKKRYGKDNKAEGWWIQYNNSGRATKRELYKKGILKEYFTYKYDKHNTLVKEERHLP